MVTTEAPRKMLITGGAGETGGLFTPKVAQTGQFPVVTISKKPRSGLSAEDWAVRFQNNVEQTTGIRPKVVIVDLSKITTQERAAGFVDLLELKEREPIDYAALAAGGLPAITIGKEYLKVKDIYEKGVLTKADLKRSTETIRDKVNTDSSIMDNAFELNVISPKLILEELIRRGHIDSLSVVAFLSSSLSDDFRPGSPHSFLGPAFYLPTAYTKNLIVGYAQVQSFIRGFKCLDLVAPEIIDTSVGRYFEDFATYISSTQKDKEKVRMSFVTKEVAAQTLVEQMTAMRSGSQRFARLYLNEDEGVYDFRPKTWAVQPLRGYF